jgi:hypothetical protein
MKHDNFKMRSIHPAVALLAMSAAMGGVQGIEVLRQKNEVDKNENGLTELDKLKLQKAAEKRQRKCIRLVASKKNS